MIQYLDLLRHVLDHGKFKAVNFSFDRQSEQVKFPA
jgi:hypothetical protein